MKNEFKFKLNERVFILGVTGMCVIIGRGQMEFSSGGKSNWYSLGGAHHGFHIENSLITIAEACNLNKLEKV